MTDLLTTKQVQALLQVDRTTIYRMVEGGQLPACALASSGVLRRGRRALAAERALRRTLQAPSRAQADAEPSRAATVAATTLAEILPLELRPGGARYLRRHARRLHGHYRHARAGPSRRSATPAASSMRSARRQPGWPAALRPHVAADGGSRGPRAQVLAERDGADVCPRPDSSRRRAEGHGVRRRHRAGQLAARAPSRSRELASLFGVPAGDGRRRIATRCSAWTAPAQERALRFVQRMADVFSQMVQDRLALVSVDQAFRLISCGSIPEVCE